MKEAEAPRSEHLTWTTICMRRNIIKCWIQNSWHHLRCTDTTADGTHDEAKPIIVVPITKVLIEWSSEWSPDGLQQTAIQIICHRSSCYNSHWGQDVARGHAMWNDNEGVRQRVAPCKRQKLRLASGLAGNWNIWNQCSSRCKLVPEGTTWRNT